MKMLGSMKRTICTTATKLELLCTTISRMRGNSPHEEDEGEDHATDQCVGENFAEDVAGQDAHGMALKQFIAPGYCMRLFLYDPDQAGWQSTNRNRSSRCLPTTQAETVSQHAHRTQRHRRRRYPRAEQDMKARIEHARRQRNAEQVIACRPDQILAHHTLSVARASSTLPEWRMAARAAAVHRRPRRELRAGTHRNTRIRLASAAASLMCQPTIATRRPLNCSARMRASLPAGSRPASTSLIPCLPAQSAQPPRLNRQSASDPKPQPPQRDHGLRRVCPSKHRARQNIPRYAVHSHPQPRHACSARCNPARQSDKKSLK